MEVLLSFLQGSPTHPLPAYSFWEFYIKNGIEEAGFKWQEVPKVDWVFGMVPQTQDSFLQWKQDAWQKTLQYIKKNKVDLFLSYLYPQQVDIEVLTEIKKLGIPIVNFFCDNVREFKKIPEAFSVFDLNWVPEYKAIQMYQKAGYPYIHLPMPMWVAPERRLIKQTENNRMSFIGSHDIQRQLFFEKILSKYPDLPLDIYGAGWETINNDTDKKNISYQFLDKIKVQINIIQTQGIIAYKRKLEQRNFKPKLSSEFLKHIKAKPNFESYTRISKESMITLGINRYPSFHYPLHKPNTYSRLRDIEAPMLGACYLTEYTLGLENMYELNKEIVVYTTEEELISQANRLMNDKPLRNSLRINGQKKALNKLSIQNSLNIIKDTLGISA